MTRIERTDTPWPEPPARPRRFAALRRAAAPIRLGRYTGGIWVSPYRLIGLIVLAGAMSAYGFVFAVYGRFFLLQLATPLFVLIALTVWLLPDTGQAPTLLLKRLLYAHLIALLCWPDYLALGLPGLPWITAVRLVGVPLVIVLLVCVSVSAKFRAEMAEILGGFPIIWKLVVAFAGIAFVSIAFSNHKGDSLSKFLIAQMSWTAIFFAAAYVFSREGRARMLGRILWGIVLLQLGIGFWESRISRVPWAGHVPSFLKIEDEAVLRILAGASRAATGIYRVQTKFTTSLGLAEFLGFALPFILHLTVTTRSLPVRLLGMVTMPAVFWLVVKTDSRLGAIGFFMTFLIYLLLWASARWRRDAKSLFAPAIVFTYPALFMTFIAATFAIGRLRAMVWGTGAQQASTDTREAMYRNGIPMVMRNPIGHGIGEAANVLGFRNGAGVLTIDTYYLAIGLEFGVIGFLVYYAMFVCTIWRGATVAYRARTPDIAMLAPITVTFINFVIIKSVFSQVENHSLIFALLGMAVALIARQRVLEREAAEKPVLGG